MSRSLASICRLQSGPLLMHGGLPADRGDSHMQAKRPGRPTLRGGLLLLLLTIGLSIGGTATAAMPQHRTPDPQATQLSQGPTRGVRTRLRASTPRLMLASR